MSTAPRRIIHAEAILGSELHSKLKDTRVLLVGAGGIGCELREWTPSDLSLWHTTCTNDSSQEYCSHWFWQNYIAGPGYN